MPNENNQTDNYSPLAENVQEKSYAASDHLESANPIPEPAFVPPSFESQKDFFEEDEKEKKTKNNGNGNVNHTEKITPKPSYSDGFVGGDNELSNKEKKRGAEAMATTFIQGYSLLCKQGAKWVMIKQSKVTKLIREGKINPDILYYAPGNVQATAPQIIEAYNNEMLEIMEVSEDFVEQVRPLLVRIFLKRGIGMSDEAQLMWIVGQDVFMKGTMLFSIKKQSADFIKSFSTGAVNNPLPDSSNDTNLNDVSQTHNQTVNNYPENNGEINDTVLEATIESDNNSDISEQSTGNNGKIEEKEEQPIDVLREKKKRGRPRKIKEGQ